jgi:MerR family transcriptional regulator/heat shock protein HspR
LHTSQSPHQVIYSIGKAAALLGISVPTLRLYEREGLLLPIRKPSGHRLYTPDDLERVRCIRETINKKKISIAGIRRLLALMPCWKIKKCPDNIRDRCPAFLNGETPCWTLKNRPWECADADCRSCPVYGELADCTRVRSMIISLVTAPGSGS